MRKFLQSMVKRVELLEETKKVKKIFTKEHIQFLIDGMRASHYGGPRPGFENVINNNNSKEV